jgi:hypothetical protein
MVDKVAGTSLVFARRVAGIQGSEMKIILLAGYIAKAGGYSQWN